MAFPRWLFWALAGQLLLAFFFPPLPLGNRFLFAADLWCLGWVSFAVFQFRRKLFDRDPALKRLRQVFWGSSLVVLVAYAHGMFRPSIAEEFVRLYYFKLSESDLFNPFREFVVALRFVVWISAAAFVHHFFQSARKLGGKDAKQAEQTLVKLSKILAVSVIVAVAFMVIERASLQGADFLAEVYSFERNADHWRDRAHGPFRSPVESAVALALSSILIMAFRRRLPKKLWVSALVSVVLGIALAKTATPFLVLLLVAVVSLAPRLPLRLRRGLLIAVAGVLASGAIALLADHPLAWAKINDLRFRFGPWVAYLKLLLSRPDYFLLGLGFAPYHTDNAYIFILTRTGVMGFAALLWFLVRPIKKAWASWPWAAQALLIYLAVVGLTLDAWIYRHVIALMLAIGVPLLAFSRRGTKGKERI
ncbi:MAG: hypothetical protein AB1540_03175 [Bdellovibrionota bacterium]